MSPTYTVVVSARARADLERYATSIFEATGFAQRAADILAAIEMSIEKLDFMPQRGAPAPAIGPHVRTLNHRGYAIILYRIDESERRVTVLRIFVRGQQWSRA